MKKVYAFIGKAAYWLGLPFLYFYLRKSHRTRLLIIADDKVLLLKSWLGSGRWGLPGGGLDPGEDMTQGAIRETLEETGIQLETNQLQHLGKATYHQHGLRFAYERFVVKLPAVVGVKPRRAEITEIKWTPLSEINNNRLDYDVKNTLEAWRGSQDLLK